MAAGHHINARPADLFRKKAIPFLFPQRRAF